MTAIEYKEYMLRCDELLGDKRCGSRFRGGVGEARGDVRKRAKRAGWTRVLSDSGRRHDEEYCPLHKLEGS